jgi:hypothetical protein
MITKENYKEKMKQLRQMKIVLPPHLEEAVIFTNTATYGGTDWEGYNSSPHIKETIDEFFELLNRHLDDMRIELPETGKTKKTTSNPVEKLEPEEIKFIRQYLSMDGEIISTNNLKDFYEKIKSAIVKKRVRKTSKWAKEVMLVQNSVVEIYNSAKTKSALVIAPRELVIKLRSALNKYYDRKEKGLSGTLDNGKGEIKIVNSLDFANQEFKTIGFSGKWHSFFGDPAPGFTAMVYALPKKGKSYFAVDFAAYLAKNFGRVLYVAREEGLDATLKKKVTDMKATHPNLDYADGLPENLSLYGFIFLDSVTKLNLSPKDLEMLEKKNPGKSFIYIHQSTKNGNFRGVNDYQHDVDMVVNFPEEGFAVQTGRYNQGGEMYIFEQPERS